MIVKRLDDEIELVHLKVGEFFAVANGNLGIVAGKITDRQRVPVVLFHLVTLQSGPELLRVYDFEPALVVRRLEADFFLDEQCIHRTWLSQ